MSVVRARRDGMDVVAEMDGRSYRARPDGWDRPGFWEALKRAFALKYHLYDDRGVEICEVHYDFLHNFILIKRADGDRQLRLPIFDLHGMRYYVKEKVTGFLIWPLVDGGRIEIVVEGEKSLKEYALVMRSEDESFDTVALEFAVGYLIRWMSFNIGI